MPQFVIKVIDQGIIVIVSITTCADWHVWFMQIKLLNQNYHFHEKF
jgi:hypothetical protein